jgi:hypothetical protein
MASRKELTRYKYPSQLEVGFERHLKDFIDRILELSGKNISITEYYCLKREIVVTRAFTLELVDPENPFCTCFYVIIEPFFSNMALREEDLNNGYVLFSLPPDMYRELYDVASDSGYY